MMMKRWLAVTALCASAAPLWAADAAPENAALAARAEAVFGKKAGQSFDAQALNPAAAAPRTDTLTVTLAPGKGAEVKAELDAGQGLVFHWTASGDLAVDLQGDKPGSQSEYTSFDIQAGQRQGAGTFVAPFTSQHGWFWKNNGQQPVTVSVTVPGFQKRLVKYGGQP